MGGRDDVGGLRQGGLLHLTGVRHGHLRAAHPLDGCVQFVEGLLGDTGGHLGDEASRPPCLGFSLRYRGHWGVHIRRLSGRLEIGVPDSEESAIRVVLADRAVTVAPGETCTLVLKADDPSE